jgi:hypothetical protein
MWLSISVIVLLIILTAALVGLYRTNEQRYENGVAHMKSGVEEATKGLLAPLGGIEQQKATVTEGEKYINSFWCVDVACPTVQSQWYLLADKDQEQGLYDKVKDAILQKSGDAKWRVSGVVGILGKSERPYSPPAGKEWFNISVSVTYAPKSE